MTFYISNALAIVLADAVDAAINAGTAATLQIYSGSVPADADASIGAAVLLATLTFSDPAFGAAVDDTPGALITADTITGEASADDTGTASFFRIFVDSTAIAQGSVGTSGADLNFNTVSFVETAEIDVTAFTILVPESV